LDYYGRRLATASSDRTIKIFDVAQDGSQSMVADIPAHEGPVWRISWAHPKFGNLLASCSYDKKVAIWREQGPDQYGNAQWVKVYEKMFDSSVGAVSWAPPEFGLALAAGIADGKIAVISFVENNWQDYSFEANAGGVNAVSWGPAIPVNALFSQTAADSAHVMRLVSGGCDNRVKVWRLDNAQGRWVEEKVAEDGHSHWIRDVAWAPSIGASTNTIASASEDGTVIIWTEKSLGEWTISERLSFEKCVWRVSWSVMGNILAVSSGENSVSLWKESLDGHWKNLHQSQE
jgi:protein transport protein SEC13